MADRDSTGEAATSGDATIRVRQVRKTYHMGERSVEALRGVNLEINEPGFYAIMGPSGSGKSTLLHLLAGLDRPDEGEIEVAAQRIDTLDETGLTAFRRRRIGIVFQQFNLISTLTARDNVMLPGMLDRMPRMQQRERADELLEALGMNDRAEHRPDALSGGEQQRVAIARALLFRPSILFADEPTGNLDSASSEQLWRMLEDIAEQRRITVLMVTHEPSAAVHCRRVFLLRDGRFESTIEVDGLDAAQLATRIQQPVG